MAHDRNANAKAICSEVGAILKRDICENLVISVSADEVAAVEGQLEPAFAVKAKLQLGALAQFSRQSEPSQYNIEHIAESIKYRLRQAFQVVKWAEPIRCSYCERHLGQCDNTEGLHFCGGHCARNYINGPYHYLYR